MNLVMHPTRSMFSVSSSQRSSGESSEWSSVLNTSNSCEGLYHVRDRGQAKSFVAYFVIGPVRLLGKDMHIVRAAVPSFKRWVASLTGA